MSAKPSGKGAPARSSLAVLLSACAGLALAQPAGQPLLASAATQYTLAQHFAGAAGQALDLQRAFVHLRQAAELGHAQAQVELAFVYFNGNERVAKDLAQAYLWFGKAAGQGWGSARQDAAEALRWYRRSAGTQDSCAPKAQYALYVSYRHGNGVARDEQLARLWLKKSREGAPHESEADH